MIWHDVEGDSPEWHMLRLGIPTASEFHRVLTPKTLKISSQAPGYMHRLLAEWLTGAELPSFESDYMALAKENEPRARRAYEMLTDTEVTNGGFFTDDAGLIGCSPDGLVGTNGDLEIKCPALNTHIGYALNGPGDDYTLQMQGRMMVHGREWVDFFSWHPALVIPPRRILRDEKTINIMRAVLTTFVEQMLECRLRLEREYGPFVRPQAPKPAPLRDGITDEDVEMLVADRHAKGAFTDGPQD